MGLDALKRIVSKGDWVETVELQEIRKVTDVTKDGLLVLVALDFYAMQLGGQTPDEALDPSDTVYNYPADVIKVTVKELPPKGTTRRWKVARAT